MARTHEDAITVTSVGGTTWRILEPDAGDSMKYAEKVAREGVWITGPQAFFVPAHRIARVDILSSEKWEELSTQMGAMEKYFRV
jgi:hypothetical protein